MELPIFACQSCADELFEYAHSLTSLHGSCELCGKVGICRVIEVCRPKEVKGSCTILKFQQRKKAGGK